MYLCFLTHSPLCSYLCSRALSSFLSSLHSRLLPIIVNYSSERIENRSRADRWSSVKESQRFRISFLLCECVILVPIHRSALYRYSHVSLGLSPRTIVSLSRSYLRLLTVAVNDYLMRYSPYTLRLMVYAIESILHAKYLFPKIGKSAVFVLSFVPYCRVVVNFIVEHVQFQYVDIKIKRRRWWEKMLLIICFVSQGRI